MKVPYVENGVLLLPYKVGDYVEIGCITDEVEQSLKNVDM